MQMLPWIAVLAVMVLALVAVLAWVLRPKRPAAPAPLPTEWALTARPVFNTDERRVYRLLREALPHHIVLSKLPLVRFCQPTDPDDVRYWFDLLGSNHVGFAVCSANGRVLAAIDLDTERGNSRRIMQIKQSVLAACRVRYLRCPADHLPSIAELQLLVPHHASAPRAPQPASVAPHRLREAKTSLASTVATRRAERTALWQDSTFFQDSFFAPDNRLDGLNSEFGSLGGSNARSASLADADHRHGEHPPEDLGGVVVDTPRHPPASTRH